MPTIEIRDVMVAMRDGVRLATDIYLPPVYLDGDKLPVLLERTPYDKRGTNHGDRTAIDPTPQSKPEIAQRFVDAGYIYVLQDCRGCFGSEGEFTKYLNEAEDGFDTLAWIRSQAWCDGIIGTLGLSYCAHVQAAAASLNPPGLGAMVLDCGGFSSAYHGGVRQGGAFELKQLTWAYSRALEAAKIAGDTETYEAISRQDIRAWAKVNPWTRGNSPISAAPEYEAYVLEQWQHDRFGPFWQQRGIYWHGYYAETANVPMIHMSGWYDPYSQTAIDNYLGLIAAGRSDMRLVLGPWTHGQRSVAHSGDVDFGAQAPLDGNLADDFVSLRVSWFDHHLRKLDAPDPLPSPVTIFVMGGGTGRRTEAGRLDHGGRWRSETSWPPSTMKETSFYLHSDRRLARDNASDGMVPFVFDPSNPVPTIGGAVTSGAPLMTAGAFDQRETSERSDVIVFETEVLDKPLELTGPVTAHLFVSSSAPDTDFTVKLIDVYPASVEWPDGFAMNLSHGILRARFRRSFEQPEPLVPRQVEPLTIHAFPTSNLFAEGHRIRVEISSSSFPHFDVNPNADWRQIDQKPVVAQNIIHTGATYPSQIVLPVMPS